MSTKSSQQTEPRVFAEPKQVLTFESPTEALEAAVKYRLTPEPYVAKDLKVTDDFQIKNGTSSTITAHGFYDFIQMLGIPKSLAMKLSNELLLRNVHKLLSISPELPLVLLRRDNGVIAGIAHAPFRGAQPDEILTLFADLPLFAKEKIEVGEDLVQVALRIGDKLVEPLKDDKIFFGVNIVSRMWNRTPVEAAVYLHRLVCTNGATIRKHLSRATFDYSLPAEDRLPKFRESVMNLLGKGPQPNILQRVLGMMNTTHYRTTDVVKLWSSISLYTGTKTADRTFGLDKDARLVLVADVNAEKITNKEKKLKGEQPTYRTYEKSTKYEVWNSVTSLANDLTGRNRFAIQRLGGEMIETEFSLN